MVASGSRAVPVLQLHADEQSVGSSNTVAKVACTLRIMQDHPPSQNFRKRWSGFLKDLTSGEWCLVRRLETYRYYFLGCYSKAHGAIMYVGDP